MDAVDDASREQLEARRDDLLRQADLLEIRGSALEDIPPSELERAREALRDGITASVRAVDGAESEAERDRYQQNADRAEEALASINPPPVDAVFVAAGHRREASGIEALLAEKDTEADAAHE